MNPKIRRLLLLVGMDLVAIPFLLLGRVAAADLGTEIFRAVAIGLAVKAASADLNKAINTLTFQNKIPADMSTKVVPILSVGEKGYVGAAQVAGPQSYVSSVQAVWLYEDNFSQNEFRLKVYVPSASLNPLELKRVQKVGISAIIDVSLDGRWKGQTYSHSVGAGDILKAGVVAVAINAAADPLNKAINSIAGGWNSSTKVVPVATIGDKAYIGGAQVAGAASSLDKVKAVYQYEDIFDGGKFRIKAFVPSDSTNPLQISRVSGIGLTALIDTSIADQQRIRERQDYWRTAEVKYIPLNTRLQERFKEDIVVLEPRHDRGLHLGWYIGKGNQKKYLTGVWAQRYRALDDKDKEDFATWWYEHEKDKPEVREKNWNTWIENRKALGKNVGITNRPNDNDNNKNKSDDRGKSDDKERGKSGNKSKNK
ncbi:MAG: hypothetical protein K6U00_02340 [Armatimonadetes bacterium]|nr:hypothetical protein [Armatimonadota bacterium]